jgi:hypothetical protein
MRAILRNLSWQHARNGVVSRRARADSLRRGCPFICEGTSRHFEWPAHGAQCLLDESHTPDSLTKLRPSLREHDSGLSHRSAASVVLRARRIACASCAFAAGCADEALNSSDMYHPTASAFLTRGLHVSTRKLRGKKTNFYGGYVAAAMSVPVSPLLNRDDYSSGAALGKVARFVAGASSI